MIIFNFWNQRQNKLFHNYISNPTLLFPDMEIVNTRVQNSNAFMNNANIYNALIIVVFIKQDIYNTDSC